MIPSSSPPSPEQPGRLTAALRAGADYIARYARSLSVDPDLLRAAALQIETLEKEREQLAAAVSPEWAHFVFADLVLTAQAQRDDSTHVDEYELANADLRLQVETLRLEKARLKEFFASYASKKDAALADAHAALATEEPTS